MASYSSVHFWIPRRNAFVEVGASIVYDYDDTLYVTPERIARHLAIEFTEWKRFYAPQNLWPREVIAKANELIADARLYEDIRFYSGVKDILRPQHEFGIPVYIKSNTLNKQMADLKTEQLMAVVDGIEMKNICMNIVQMNVPTVKNLGVNTIVFVDDTPYHIVHSTAWTNVMPKQPWNTSLEGQLELRGRHVIMLDSLEKINRFVYHRTKLYLRTGKLPSSGTR